MPKGGPQSKGPAFWTAATPTFITRCVKNLRQGVTIAAIAPLDLLQKRA